jgi:hypothetical protein
MTGLWTYQDSLDVSRDIVGYDVEATDGEIGKIDESSTATGRGYLIVDTGFWIFRKKRLLPAGVVSRVDHDGHKVYVAMTKDQMKDAPDYKDLGAGWQPSTDDPYARYFNSHGSW